YRTTNQMLDSIALRTSNFIQSQGYEALQIPASQTLDRKRWRGTISHKMVATQAGVGWIGKNALLITPQYGPRVRLVTVLTDAPLHTANPIIESRCGECQTCVEFCPPRALLGVNWNVKLQRKHLMQVNLCAKETRRNEKLVGNWICGVCISVCPYGRKQLR
ncbi:MAG: 4Fe-4S double cluster binding domain-containing protein, partial [Candidatus Hodarchaeota archaeon]